MDANYVKQRYGVDVGRIPAPFPPQNLAALSPDDVCDAVLDGLVDRLAAAGENELATKFTRALREAVNARP